MNASRHIALAIAAITLIAGCGTAHSSAPTGAAAGANETPPIYVFFKRAQGVDPLASQLTVYADGTAVAVITNGGVDGAKKHTFSLSLAGLRHLRYLVARTRLRDTRCCNTELYTYWVTAGGQSARLEQGAVPRPMRPLLADLNAITDAHTNY